MATIEITEEGRRAITLQPGDPEVGVRTDKGMIEKWPMTDVLGQPYERTGACQRGVDSRGKYFVIIPPRMDAEIDVLGFDVNPVISPMPGPDVEKLLAETRGKTRSKAGPETEI